MWLFGFPEMLDVHVSGNNIRKMNDNKIRRIIFDKVLLGHNLISLDIINEVSSFICEQSIEHLEELEIDEIKKSVGQIYDESGNLH